MLLVSSQRKIEWNLNCILKFSPKLAHEISKVDGCQAFISTYLQYNMSKKYILGSFWDKHTPIIPETHTHRDGAC